MLPDLDTYERYEINCEALHVSRKLLDEAHGDIHVPLQRTFVYFHDRFIEERTLDPDARSETEWQEMILDAKQLQAYVADAWSSAIRHFYSAASRLSGC